ncbi:hypothetical protein CKAN_00162300 [Cinnamomum micranthum f. kanehirae]|uniref:NAC domain-containing protein n=1 Tax=Cinnamomum micranthum f. kanehirae TaxID=337451 RepID=A0A443N4D4_9MAGN|nr:hypothetical protein CKAN_00162300 [Cinnamomum micranthum f. kanehirae]
MASRRNAFSSMIDHRLNPDLFIGFHFLPTYEDGIRIVNNKNAGRELPPIFNEYRRLFQCQPKQLEECYCFTDVAVIGNKVNRALGEDSRYYWKNINKEFVKDDNNTVIGCVTKLVLHKDKNTPTEWHILEYRDRKTADAGRWVLCQIYKREKNNDNVTG